MAAGCLWGTAEAGAARRGAARKGAAWTGAARRGAAWRGAARRGAAGACAAPARPRFTLCAMSDDSAGRAEDSEGQWLPVALSTMRPVLLYGF